MFTNSPIVGTENVFTQDNVTIYPNPGTDNFYFRINNAKSREIHLKVCDLHGRQIYVGKYNTNENISITTAGWLPGIYVVEMLSTKGDKSVVKVVKL